MLSLQNIFDTIDMVDKQHLDIRTITMGISLLDCADEDMDRCCDKIYDKICSRAEKLVQTGCDIESEFGIPIVNKRISVTPIVIAGAAGLRLGLALLAPGRLRRVDALVQAGRVGARLCLGILAMLVFEAAFGLPGVVAGPIYYAYLKSELKQVGMV